MLSEVKHPHTGFLATAWNDKEKKCSEWHKHGHDNEHTRSIFGYARLSACAEAVAIALASAIGKYLVM